MSRVFGAPSVVFLIAAFVLSFLTSISLPFLPPLDITRTHTELDTIPGLPSNIKALLTSEIRFGIWAACEYDFNDKRTCGPTGHGYEVHFIDPSADSQITTISSSWTRGLAVHPVATGATFIALVLAFTGHTIATFFVSFLAAFLTLIAFAIDIALFAFVRHEVNKIAHGFYATHAGPGFWMTLVSFVLLIAAGCTVCFGHRKERMGKETSIPMANVWSRFRNRN